MYLDGLKMDENVIYVMFVMDVFLRCCTPLIALVEAPVRSVNHSVGQGESGATRFFDLSNSLAFYLATSLMFLDTMDA